jgi:hypothetical protein
MVAGRLCARFVSPDIGRRLEPSALVEDPGVAFVATAVDMREDMDSGVGGRLGPAAAFVATAFDIREDMDIGVGGRLGPAAAFAAAALDLREEVSGGSGIRNGPEC